jgi:hypothetical protein
MTTGKITFQIVYGMHARGISKLRYLGQAEFRSVGTEDFTAEIQKLHDQIKGKLHDNNHRYKNIIDQRRKEVNF